MLELTKKVFSFRLEDLNYQYIPKLIDDSIWHADMSLPNSPQVEILKIWLEHGWDWDKLMNSRMAQDRRFRRENGMDKWTEKKIKEHLEYRIGILKSIKKRGYKKSLSKNQPLAVLEKPLFKGGKSPEIYHGGRRCAALYVLGYETVNMAVAKIKDKTKYKRWDCGKETA